jgi:hypothetical protein
MEERDDWVLKLEEAALTKADHLAKHKMPKLKKYFSLYQTYFDNIYQILIRKSLLQEDPYKYEEKISELKTPPKTDIHDAERKDQMRQRLSAFKAQLDYLNTYYQCSLEFLNLDRIKKVVDLLNYFPWSNLTGSLAHSVTINFADYFRRINMGTDKMTSKILSDTVAQITGVMQAILIILKEVTDYQRELYKLEVRRTVIPELRITPRGSEEDMKAIKQIYPKKMEGKPFYPDLIKEIFTEEVSVQGAQLKEDVLAKLKVEEDKPRASIKVSYKGLLIQAIRYLASAGFQLEDVVNKLSDNHQALMSRKVGIARKFNRLLKRLFGGGIHKQVYEIECLGLKDSTAKTERIDFNSFIVDLKNKIKLYSTLTREESIASKQLRANPEQKIYNFLNRNLSALQTIHRRLIGLNNYFRSEFQGEKNIRHRGLKVELTAIKNSIVKANQKKHEYVSLKEQQEQLKKMGIKQSENTVLPKE